MSQSRGSLSLSGAAALLAVSLSVGCVAPGPGRETVAALAEQLVEELGVRTDPRSVQVLVGSIHHSPRADEERQQRGSTRDMSGPEGQGHDEDDVIGMELEHALIVELSHQLNVVEAEHARKLGVIAEEGELMSFAGELGATHILVGDYIPKDGRLIVALRLIDTKTLLITTAIRGWVSEADLGSPIK